MARGNVTRGARWMSGQLREIAVVGGDASSVFVRVADGFL